MRWWPGHRPQRAGTGTASAVDQARRATLQRRAPRLSWSWCAVLAACRPGRFTIADSRALATLRGLGRMPPGSPGFRLADWLPYLRACRILAGQCGQSLRQLDRALWIGASSPQSPG